MGFINRVLSSIGNKFSCFPPLFFRVLLGYAFYEPAMKKWGDVEGTIAWFGTLEIPYPEISFYMAATTEALAVVLLPLGFLTRLIAFPVMITMLVAIYTVHWVNGFPACDGGFEIPFYYFLMAFSLFTTGAGGLSLDGWCCSSSSNPNE